MLNKTPAAVQERKRVTALSASDLPQGAWSIRRDVRFSDCDPAGIVYTPRFIDMASGVIEDFFIQELGIDYHAVIQTDRVGLGYASVETHFLKPALMGDRLVFTPVIEHIGGSSAIFIVHCLREATEIMRCKLVMVTTSLDLHRPIPIPAALKTALLTYQDKCR